MPEVGKDYLSRVLPNELLFWCTRYLDHLSYFKLKKTCTGLNKKLQGEYNTRLKKYALQTREYHLNCHQEPHLGSLPCLEGDCQIDPRNQRLGAMSHLRATILKNDMITFEKYLDAGLDPNMFIDGNWEPFAIHMRIKMFKLLLKRGADVTLIPYENSDTKRRMIDWVGDFSDKKLAEEWISLFMKYGASFTSGKVLEKLCEMESAAKQLWLAAKNGVDFSTPLEKILSLDAQRIIWDTFDEPAALHFATCWLKPIVIDIILRHQPEQRRHLDSAFNMAVRRNCSKTAVHLLRKGARLNVDLLEGALKVYPLHDPHRPDLLRCMAARVDLGNPEPIPQVQRYLELAQSGSPNYGVILPLLKKMSPKARLLCADSLDIETYRRDLEEAREYLSESTDIEELGSTETEESDLTLSWWTRNEKEITEILELMEEAIEL
ncbi:hypothetical protein BO94DRAFT_584202 [Aspergillus sclerotioniger CBS 115572]|uniref:Uncharacterized protein n=1 Tax=Aspergillus sclerotioniger CBS 115572 TaxID=1450535 RepID=A0A317WZ13_9EURO|nr:hypothetical protein BO94DRAFT_584202 [Aspergillus sclerotioniger CBS 115572]PWY91593.1 hypothetical protein BO94DRAFT_584202 [Aspergillus sclerotioniger CBS 115572]